MKYKPLVVKGAPAKDFIRSVHHVQGSAENCNTTWDSYCMTNGFHSSWLPSIPLYRLCGKHHNPFPTQQAYFGGQTLELSAAIIKTSSGFLLVLLDTPWRQVLPAGHCLGRLTRQPQKGSSLSHDERSPPLSRSPSTPFVDSLPPPPFPCGTTCWKSKPTRRCVSYPVNRKSVSKSAPAQCKNSSSGSFTYLFANTWFR